jgi:hypothetical protein
MKENQSEGLTKEVEARVAKYIIGYTEELIQEILNAAATRAGATLTKLYPEATSLDILTMRHSIMSIQQEIQD